MKISDEQFGFIPGRSAADAIFILKILWKSTGNVRNHCIVCLYLEKVYDLVPREL